ncbi:3-isopropylmalate dehydratase small subunit 2, partial [Bacteroidota bacterium]
GFKVVISSFFADIFRNNALNNGLLVIQLSKEFHSSLINETCENPELLIEIDLKEQSVKIKGTNKKEIFEINQYKKECLLNGYDDVDYLLSCKNIIEEFEQKTNK